LELIKIKAQVEDERSEVWFAAQVPGLKKNFIDPAACSPFILLVGFKCFIIKFN